MAGVVSYRSGGKGGATMVSASNGGDGGGDGEQVQRFGWTDFYMAVANALLRYRDDRRSLADGIAEIAARTDLPFAITDQFPPDRSRRPLEDICPFTAMGVFNRSLTDANRSAIAGELAEFLQVAEPAPAFSFKDNGIPLLNNQNSWFFAYAYWIGDHDIDNLWRVFAEGIAFADGETDDPSAFIRYYDIAQSQNGVAYNLTMGLYWMRPWRYPPLDGNSRRVICNLLSRPQMRRVPSGADYLKLADELRERFQDPDFLVHSFQHLSWAAYQNDPPRPAPVLLPQTVREPDPPPLATPESASYTIDSIVNDGCFLDRGRLETMLRRLNDKRNIILQGPPGTGKTWLAKRLAYALVGSKDADGGRVRALQFHPNMSYEDFVRGWRPAGDANAGRLQLVDGPFLQLCEDARQDPGGKYVLVIEEVNRGNPAQIFGEMLTLLESDKRTAGEAMALAYPRCPKERVYIPPNVYVIGTMNVADRSLALVDFALRRRFAFFDLEPIFGKVWRDWVSDNAGIPGEFLLDVERRLTDLNKQIADDRSLGRQFRIGHSVVTPPPGVGIGNATEWFRQVVESEIAPLLNEYWFDDPGKADEATAALLAELG